jgi:hypothetical protein
VSNDYAPAGHKSLAIHGIGNLPANAIVQVANQYLTPEGEYRNYTITPDATYELSAYLSTHRCSGHLVAVAIDDNGNTVGEWHSNHIVYRDNWRGSYEDFPRGKVVFTVPSTARLLHVVVRLVDPTGPDPYVFVSALMLASSVAGRTVEDVSPYVAPGLTTIDGGNIYTNSLHANKIIADSITAREIHADAIETRHIKAGAIETSHMDAGSINADILVSGSVKALQLSASAVTASKLGIVSSNMAYNPDFSQGTRGWVHRGGDLPGIQPQYVERNMYAPDGHASIVLFASVTAANAAGKYYDIGTYRISANEATETYRVTPDVCYEFSCCVSTHRCAAQLFVQWFDANGNHIAFTGTDPSVSDTQVNRGTYADYPKLKHIVWAPAGAATAAPFVRMMNVIADTPYVFISCFMMAATRKDAAETSPYVVPGVTTIDGSGIITNSLEAGKITAGTITTRELNVTNIFADTAVISNISAKVLVTDAIKTDMIKAGQITGSKLLIASANMAYNPDFSQGLRGWYAYYGQYAASEVVEFGINTDWCPTGFKAAMVRTTRTGPQPDTRFGLQQGLVRADGSLGDYPVIAGSTYEFSAFMSNHRCEAWIYVDFVSRNANGTSNYLQTSIGTLPNGSGGGAGGDPATYPRIRLVAKAPAGATYAIVYFMGNNPSGPDVPYLFVSGFMMAACREGMPAAETSPYVAPGITSIDGSTIITNTIKARHIEAGSINTGHMTANTIDAKVLTSGSIVAGKLAADAVEAINIKADAITASKLYLTDLSNMVQNGDFLDGTSEGWWLYGDGHINTSGTPGEPGGKWRCVGSSEYVIARSSKWVQVNPGDVLYASVMVFNNKPGSGAAGLYFEMYNQEDGDGQGSHIYTNQHFGWVRVEGRVTVPAGRQKVRVCLFADYPDPGQYTYFGKVQVRRANSAEMIVDGAITANKIEARAIKSGHIDTDTINAGHITTGAIGTDELAAGAITADKIAVGLNTGNLIWNSDFALNGFWQGPATSPGYTDIQVYRDTTWHISGTEASIAIHHPTSIGAGQYAYIDLTHPQADGTMYSHLRVQGGKLYEFSVYLSAHRCAGYAQAFWWSAENGYADAGTTNVINYVAGNGAPADNWRAKLKTRAPAWATHILLRIFMGPGTDNSAPYVFASGLYLGLVPEGLPSNVFSDYAPQSRTIISGGSIATNSLDASKIVSKSITTDHIKAASLDINNIAVDGTISAHKLSSDVLIADRIRVWGDYTLAGWRSGTEIAGGVIASNTIRAQSLLIGSRPMTVVGLNFEMQVDGNGNKTGWMTWTGGYLSIIGDGGENAGFNINAGSIYTNFQETHIWWNRGWADLAGRVGGSDAPVGAEKIAMAYWSPSSGLAVLKGGTNIDGDKITTRSIKAAKIGVAEIQTDHMGFNSIHGNRIVVGTLEADRITSGVIQAGTIQLGTTGRFQLQADGRRMRIYGNNWSEQVCIGDISPWVTGQESQNYFGIIVRNQDNREIFKVGGDVAWIDGAFISQASIGAAQIGDLQVKNAHIDNLTIGNGKISDYAISTLTAASSGGTSTDTWTAARTGASKFLILALFNGNSSSGSLAGPGNFIIYRNGTPLINVAASFAIVRVGSENQFYLNSMCIGCIDQPGAGSVNYQCLHTNGQGVGGVTILALEMSK